MTLLDRLKKLFRIAVADKTDAANSLDIAFVHEDDQCQIELSPAENLKFLLRQCGKIEDF